MRTETRTVRIGEWLGNVPDDWDYEGFYKTHLGQNRDYFNKAVALFKEMDRALREGKKVFATQSSQFTYEVYHCGLYDGGVFWVPRPSYSYKGPIAGEHIGEFYNITAIKIKDGEKQNPDTLR